MSKICSFCNTALPGSRKPNKSGLCKLCYNKQWRKKNIDRLATINANWYLENKEYKNNYSIQYQANRKKEDINYRLRCRLRQRLRQAVKNSYKSGSAVADLGCSVGELKKHLESQFVGGMTWENWGHNGWHIDHIKPLSGFDLTNREELLKACHYTNLQPLWARDNWVKGGHDEN